MMLIGSRKGKKKMDNKLLKAYQIAMEALSFYKSNQVYYYQQGSDWGTECSDVAEKAINRIRQLEINTLDTEAGLPSDLQISSAALKICNEHDYNGFIEGAKWMRSKIDGK
jgi:hypothetical protein